jgi:tRNA A37 N6-isopentenylltransferase MiaA
MNPCTEAMLGTAKATNNEALSASKIHLTNHLLTGSCSASSFEQQLNLSIDSIELQSENKSQVNHFGVRPS